MTTPVTSRWRAATSARLMNDAELETTLTGIQKVAPQSTLMAVPTIAASYTALTTKGTTFAANVAAAAASETLHATNVAAMDISRVAFGIELDTFKTLVENNATSAGDVISTGLTLLLKQNPSRTPPDPPAALVVKLGKVRGKARVAVAGKGQLGTFAAQVSTDPIGAATLVNLPGAGKERKLSGYASGTRVWVRFALIRFGMQSDWSVPVLITFP